MKTNIITIQLEHVSFAYHSKMKETMALQDISFNVYKGEVVAIVGPSGCGKSTLLSLLSGLRKPEEGQLYIQGEIGYMLQKDHLLEWRNVMDNAALGLEIQHKKNPQTLAHLKKMLTIYGLDAFALSKPSELSGGMRQRAALIRTLVLNPDILLLDEPCSALDYQTKLWVNEDMIKIIKKEQKTAILVSHDLSEAISMADRIIILSPRPGTIQTILHLDFPEDESPLQRRSNPEFSQYFDLAWKEMKNSYDAVFT
ncbi:spermidine/putrescine ABC transporter ATP-binding protein [Clostridia bacterium]|nr:spermidine/putrescine ABC transporter ATP-binding protein [Clostridia bacterium]